MAGAWFVAEWARTPRGAVRETHVYGPDGAELGGGGKRDIVKWELGRKPWCAGLIEARRWPEVATVEKRLAAEDDAFRRYSAVGLFFGEGGVVEELRRRREAAEQDGYGRYCSHGADHWWAPSEEVAAAFLIVREVTENCGRRRVWVLQEPCEWTLALLAVLKAWSRDAGFDGATVRGSVARLVLPEEGGGDACASARGSGLDRRSGDSGSPTGAT